MVRLKELRLKKEFTQKELSAVLNIPQNTLSQWENGNAVPDYKRLIQLADYFEVSIDYLLGHDVKHNNTDNST